MTISAEPGPQPRRRPLPSPSSARPAPDIRTAIPGPGSRAIFEREQKVLAPGRQRISLLAGLAFDHGKGATLTDVDGNDRRRGRRAARYAGVRGRGPSARV